MPLVCDLTIKEQIDAAFDRVNRELGGVDILVNNAGIFVNALVLDEENHEDIFEKMIQTNLMAVVFSHGFLQSRQMICLYPSPL